MMTKDQMLAAKKNFASINCSFNKIDKKGYTTKTSEVLKTSEVCVDIGPMGTLE